jgi:hypothetical protein
MPSRPCHEYWHSAASAQEEKHEYDAHHRVADERFEALVQVVGAAEHRPRRHDPGEAPAEGAQVADHDELFEDRGTATATATGRASYLNPRIQPVPGERSPAAASMGAIFTQQRTDVAGAGIWTGTYRDRWGPAVSEADLHLGGVGLDERNGPQAAPTEKPQVKHR